MCRVGSSLSLEARKWREDEDHLPSGSIHFVEQFSVSAEPLCQLGQILPPLNFHFSFFFFFWPHHEACGMRELSSLTRDQIHAPFSGSGES